MLRNEWKAVQSFSEAAKMHCEASAVLLKACETEVESPLAHAAIYLAGYAVECILKARWLSAIRPKRHRRALQILKKLVGHDLDKMLELFAVPRKPIFIPANIERHIRFIRNFWRSEMRYRSSEMPVVTANVAFNRVREIVEWCKT